MPKLVAEDYHADELEEALANAGFKHLRVRRRADVLTIESGPKADPFPHARVRRDTLHLWTLEMPTASGRWELAPVREVFDNLVPILTSVFPWALAKPPSIPPERARARARART
jgi:hypothetical protein